MFRGQSVQITNKCCTSLRASTCCSSCSTEAVVPMIVKDKGLWENCRRTLWVLESDNISLPSTQETYKFMAQRSKIHCQTFSKKQEGLMRIQWKSWEYLEETAIQRISPTTYQKLIFPSWILPASDSEQAKASPISSQWLSMRLRVYVSVLKHVCHRDSETFGAGQQWKIDAALLLTPRILPRIR